MIRVAWLNCHRLTSDLFCRMLVVRDQKGCEGHLWPIVFVDRLHALQIEFWSAHQHPLWTCHQFSYERGPATNPTRKFIQTYDFLLLTSRCSVFSCVFSCRRRKEALHCGGKIHCIVMHFAAQRPVRLPTFLLKESSWQHALDEKHTSFLLGKGFAGITLLNRNVCVQASARVSATLFYEHPRDDVFVQYIWKYRHTDIHWLYIHTSSYFCKHVDVEFLPQTAVNCHEELLVRPGITSLDLTSMGPGVWRSRMAQLPGGHFRPVVEPTVPIILWPKIIAFSKYIYICHIYMI